MAITRLGGANAITGTIPTSVAPGKGKILQVVETTKTDTFSSSTAGSFTDITGMSATITPSSTSSKILVLLNINSDGGNNSHIRLVRGSTAIGIGDAASSRSRVSGGAARNSTSANNMANNGISFLDSPSSTSATTYKVQFYLWSSESWYLNRSDSDGNDGYGGRSASTITLMEIAG